MKKLFCLLAALALLAQPLRAAEEPKRYLALTFDDGPSGELTERLLEGLAERQVHATFFVCGYRHAASFQSHGSTDHKMTDSPASFAALKSVSP